MGENLNEKSVQNIEELDLKEMIRKAKSIACTEFNFQELEKFNTISEVLKNLSIEKIVKYLYLYSFYVIGGRFPVAESYIARDSGFSYLYAIDIIEGRFPRGEPVIAGNPLLSYSYARDVIGDRFSRGESVIIKHIGIAKNYAETFNCTEILEN